MGVVFRATWRRQSREEDVAIKILKAAYLTPTEFTETAAALEDEGSKLYHAHRGDLVNPFVVPCYGFVRGSPSQAWRDALGGMLSSETLSVSGAVLVGIVMKYESGGSLYKRLYGESIPWAARTTTRLRLLEHIAEGVARLHASEIQIIHGDIKPENVLLASADVDAKPLLTDFGISRVRTIVTTSPGLSRSSTGGGGTPNYMAPEMFPRINRGAIIEAIPASRKTDVYALSTLCWEVLNAKNERPWLRFDPASRLTALRDGENLDWNNALRDDVPRDLKDVLERAVALNPDERPSAMDLVTALHSAQAKFPDVFLSHAWEHDSATNRYRHHKLTTFVRSVLRCEVNASVWVDEDQMGLKTDASMREGVAQSTCVVALLSRKYASSSNCMFELRQAHECGKTIIPVLVDSGEPPVDPLDLKKAWLPKVNDGTDAEREIARIIAGSFFVDLREAAAAGVADWAAELKLPEAMPRLVDLVNVALGRSTVPTPARADPGPNPDPEPNVVEAVAYNHLADIALAQAWSLQEGIALKIDRDVNARTKSAQQTLLMRAAESGNTSVAAALIRAGADVNLKDKDLCTALMYAAREAKTATAVAILAVPGIDVNAKDKDGWTALIYAARQNCYPVVEALLAVPIIDFNAMNDDQMSALMFAARNRDDAIHLLLAIPGIDLNAQNKEGMTALMLAAINGLADIVTALLAMPGIDVTKKASSRFLLGKTALTLAIDFGHNQIADALRAHEAFITSAPRVETALGVAGDVMTRDAAAVSVYNRRADKELAKAWCPQENITADMIERDVDARGAYRRTLLIAAAVNGNTAVAEALIRIGADINAKDSKVRGRCETCRGRFPSATHSSPPPPVPQKITTRCDRQGEYEMTALMRAVINGHTATVSALLSAPGISVNARGARGETALLLAVEEDHADILNELLSVKGINVNAKDTSDRNALISAARAGKTAFVSALLANPSIDINARENNDFTALMWAAGKGQIAVVAALLAAPGIAIDLKSKHGLTALMTAVVADNLAVVGLLLEARGIDVNARDDTTSFSALMIAALMDHKDIVAALLAATGVDVNAKSNKGTTALMIAAKEGHAGVVTALLADSRVDVNALGPSGFFSNWTALSYAKSGRHATIVAALKARGAK